jgi:hypothetical protein
MKLRKKIFVTLLVILFTLCANPSKAQTSEFPIIYTEAIEDGGILGSYPVIDNDTILHSFITLQTDKKKIIHHYVKDNVTHQSLFASNFREIEFLDSFLYNGSFYVFYSEYTFSSLTHYKLYRWSPESEDTTIITSFSDFELYAIRFQSFFFLNNSYHFLYTILYGVEYVFMNVTHYHGLNNFTRDEYFIANYYQKAVVDIIIDVNGTIWYLFQEWNTPSYLGILRYLGIGKLENQGMTYVDSFLFEGITYQVDRFETYIDKSSNFSFMFFHANTMYYGTFNGTNITYDTQFLKLNYYINNFIRKTIGNITKVCLIAKLGISNFVYFYEGYFNTDTQRWVFNSISTQFQVLDHTYGYDSNFNHSVFQYASIIPSSILESPRGFEFENENLMVLMTLSSIETIPEAIMEDIGYYNIFRNWLSQNLVVFILAIVAAAGVFVAIIILLKRKIPKAIKFLRSTEEFGKITLIVLISKNTLRFLANAWETFKIIGFSNKRRTILTISSLVITGFLLNSFIIISESQQPAMINAFYDAQDLTDNRVVTAELNTALEHLDDSPSDFTPLYHQLAEEELVNIYSDLEVGKYVDTIKSTYSLELGTISDGNFHHMLTSIPNDSSEIISMILNEGRVPTNSNEIVMSAFLKSSFSINLNDTINLTISSVTQSAEDIGNFTIEMKAVGFYSMPTSTEIRTITEYLGEHYDLFRKMRMSHLITTNDFLFQMIASSKRFELMLQGFYQIDFDFNDFQMSDRIVLLNEQRTMVNKTYTFSFDSSSSITISEEMMWMFGFFNNYYMQNMARILFFACPAFLLSIFMVIESSDLFSTSYEQEVDILRKKGLRRAKIARVYLSVRTVEALVATLISFGIAVLTSIPLIRIEGFLSFTNQDTKLIISNVFINMIIVFGILIVISVPKILTIASKRRKYEKDPKKLLNLIKKLPFRDLAILIPGIVLFQIFYNRTLVSLYTQEITNYIANLMLTLLGALFLIVGGLPIAIKILSIVWRFLGTVLWKTRKNKITYIFAEISKDIRYFENITVIFLLVIIIIVPSIVIPFSREQVLTDQALFLNGSDLVITNWDDVENVSQEQIENFAQVENTANVRLYSVLYGALIDVHILVVNKTDFINTVHEPSGEITGFNWTNLQLLDYDSIIISNTVADEYGVVTNDQLLFSRTIGEDILTHTVTIVSTFELFPIYLTENENIRGKTMVIISNDCFDLLEPLTPGIVPVSDNLLVKLRDKDHMEEMKEQLFQLTQKRVVSYLDVRDTLKTPLYNIFIIEIFLSLGVASVIFIFSSYTTATKVIEKRIIKHELMKKTGLKANTIVNLTLAESSLAALIPGLGIGMVVGNFVLQRLLSLLAFAEEPYSKYAIVYPSVALVIIFVLIPIILYLSLNWNLRREFRRYAPTIME